MPELKRKKRFCVYCGKKTYVRKEDDECYDCHLHEGFNNSMQRYGDL